MIKVSKEVIRNWKSKAWKYNGQAKKTKRIAKVLKPHLIPITFKLFGFPIFWQWTDLMTV